MKKVFLLILFLFLLSKPAIAVGVEYYLPYPGILPDSPFYVLKVLRDKVVSWTIQDPVQKSFYLLLLSDKRLAAGQVLINSGKEEIGANTLMQSGEYFKDSIDLAEKLSREKRQDLISKLVVAGAKHTQVVGALGLKITKVGQKSWQTAVDDNFKSQSRVMDLYLQK